VLVEEVGDEAAGLFAAALEVEDVLDLFEAEAEG
jgi:hypothetical protein